MASQETLRDVPSDRVDEIVKGFKALGATVQTFAQGDGLFTIVALFQGSPHSTPFATADAAEVIALTPSSEDAQLPSVNKSTEFADLSNEYRAFFDTCVPAVNHQDQIASRVDHLVSNAPRYKALGTSLQIPWFFVGVIHSLESNFDFTSHLHNGDPLSARTVHVPEKRPTQGEPPFTWEESATDALRMKGFSGQADWSLARMLFRWESYNGFGYRRLGLPSPYLWSFSQHYTKGLFVKDHVFDPDKVSRQCGAAVLLRVLQTRI